MQKIFFTIAGTFVYLYLFLSVPGSFDENLGNLSEHPVAHDPDRGGRRRADRDPRPHLLAQVKKLWEQAKQGGAILSRPKEYLTHAFLPSLLSWLCKLAVIGIFLAAFAIPVTFESIMWVIGSGSLANVVSFTPGAVGITQATNALALDTCCDVAKSTAVDYSTAQQLITTAWNVLVALVLVVLVFGWTGGKLLVGESYTDAKVKVAEQKAQRAEKKEARSGRSARSPGRRFHRAQRTIAGRLRRDEEETRWLTLPSGPTASRQPGGPSCRACGEPLSSRGSSRVSRCWSPPGSCRASTSTSFWGALLVAVIVAAS